MSPFSIFHSQKFLLKQCLFNIFSISQYPYYWNSKQRQEDHSVRLLQEGFRHWAMFSQMTLKNSLSSKILRVCSFTLAYRIKTSSIVVTEAPKLVMPSSTCLSSKSVNRDSNLKGKNAFILQRWEVNPSYHLGFLQGKKHGLCSQEDICSDFQLHNSKLKQ